MSAKLGELLISQGLVTRDQVHAALEHRKKNKSRLGAALIQLGHMNEKVFATFLSKQYGITAISLEDLEVPEDVTKVIPRSLCEKHCLIPINFAGPKISIALSDPTNVSAVDDVRFLSNMDAIIYIATESSILAAIERAYPNAGGNLEKIIDQDQKKEDPNTGTVEIGIEAEAADVEDKDAGDGKPVIKLINALFVEGIRRKASDIHIEPFEEFVRVRFRIHGVLHEIMKAPVSMRSSIPARIKVMANMNISEKRLPQDGRIQVRAKDRKIDIRVSVLPTVLGEKVVMRLLDQGSSAPDLIGIGFEEEQLKKFKLAATQPYGMVLVTGPTGSGKSTTLFAALSDLNAPDVNISTVEDPVEYRMLGINQTQMRENIGLTFAAALRSLLRQDPDIIMIGEIRDQETAEIAVKSALTGHMVFSTLHTNDAPSTVTRLLHMGIEPFLITAALTLVQAQRLIRVICENCAEPDLSATQELLLSAEMPEHWIGSFTPMRGKGCERCAKTGFKGRRGMFEVMYVTEKLRALIVKQVNSDELKKVAIEEGMMTLRQHGLLKLYRGETTLEEVLNNSRPDGDIYKK